MKFGPWASRDTWASVRGASDRFFTHLDCTVVVMVKLPHLMLKAVLSAIHV